MDAATEDRLAHTALRLAAAMRDNPAAAHRTLQSMARLELEQVACALAAFVPPNRAPRGVLRQLTRDIRDDLAAAHRTVRYQQHAELERTCLALAAAVPDDIPLVELAWWRTLAPALRKGSEAA